MPVDGCDGVCDSSATIDQCGICDDNADNDDINCTGCTESTACNYDVEASISCVDCCLYPSGACQICSEGAVVNNDSDNDFSCDDADNCPNDSNEDQSDGDGDLIGDVCDSCPLDSGHYQNHYQQQPHPDRFDKLQLDISNNLHKK
jgi:hypothetical protein